ICFSGSSGDPEAAPVSACGTLPASIATENKASPAGTPGRPEAGAAAGGTRPLAERAGAPLEGAMFNKVSVLPSAAHGDGKPLVSSAPLVDFLMQLEDYTLTIPDAVAGYHLSCAGFDASDRRGVQLISLTAQKFFSDIASDALQHCKIKGTGSGSSRSKSRDRKCTLTVEDLSPPDLNVLVCPHVPTPACFHNKLL
ncbi:transcription initiation factor TFIID subunit 10-like, partial [Aotus nancymaae]|uniref:transcription initiation factor TFIID subunit 10-like n=1 Tax=Aotus nancymaae TaxID=37293 RepID=UPI0030FE6BAD